MTARTKSRARFRLFIAIAIAAVYGVHYFRRNYTAPALWINDELELPALRAEDRPATKSWCDDRFGRQYLQNLRDFSTNYCSPGDRDEVRCFHSSTAETDRTDSFCVLNSTTLDNEWKTFHTQCRPRKLTNDEVTHGVPTLEKLSSYWYGTGAGTMMEKWVRFDVPSGTGAIVPEPTTPYENEKPPDFLMLITREGDGGNIWHTFMEIMSMTMTLDVLKLPSKGEKPILSGAEARNGQVVILDEHLEGPFFHLWKLATPNYRILRRSDLKADRFINTKLILPLAGGGNPFWQGDWKLNSCGPSLLLQTFVRRVLESYDIPQRYEHHSRKPTITFIDRKSKRRLIGQETLLASLKKKYPNANVQTVDFADHSLEDQIRIARKTDVLVGIHGAGLTHSIFLEPESAVVEIMPEGVNFKGFENIAGQLNVRHFSAGAYGSRSPEEMDRGWQFNDVVVELGDVVKQVDAAMRGMQSR
jgi:protein O-GlcNAc transferase